MTIAPKTPTFLVTAELWITQGHRSLFNAFEKKAIKIMAKYYGRLMSAHVVQSSTRDNPPDEIHIIEFPNESAFESYKRDEALLALAEMRKSCILRTEIHIGQSNLNIE